MTGPRIPESELYWAEKRVLQVFRDRGERVCVDREVPAVISKAKRVLRSDFLRDLFLGNYESWDPCEVVIAEATIQDRLDLNYCKIIHPLHFEKCEFSDGISLRNSVIPFLDLDNCTIYGSGKMNRGYRINSLDADKLEALMVILRSKTTIKGSVSLAGASINGQLRCNDSAIKDNLFAKDLKAEDVILDLTADGYVDMANTVVTSRFICSGGVFNQGISLIDAEVKTLESDKKSWPKKGSLYLDGFHYQRLKGGAGDSAQAGLEWLSRMGDGEFHPQPYEQLMSVYRRMGHTNWARDIGYKLEEERGKKSDEFKGWRRIHRRIWHCILKMTIGYGYKPLRFTYTAGILWLLGFLVFTGADRCNCGLWLSPPSVPDHYPQFIPAAYALEALFPVFDFGQLDNWYPGSTWLLVLRWSMTFIGTVLFGDAIRQILGVLGPRWSGGGGGG